MANVGDTNGGKVEIGVGGVIMKYGQGVFATTFATTTIDTGLQHVQSVFLTPNMAPDVTEELYVTKTGANGTLAAASTGTITIARVGTTKTSALKFDWLAFGW